MDVQTTESRGLTEPAKTIANLTDEIKSLKVTVKTLQNELDFVLSFLGITNIANSNRQSTDVEQPARQTSHAAATPSHTDGLVSTDLSILSSSDATSLPTNCSDAFVKNDQPQSYANIVSNHPLLVFHLDMQWFQLYMQILKKRTDALRIWSFLVCRWLPRRTRCRETL